MTRLALISDIHGNDVAFRAVLDDIARVGADEIICLGDVATLGPEPRAALRRLRDADLACVRGNHDAFLVDPDSIHRYTKDPGVLAAVAWCRDQVSDDDIAWLGTFEPTIRRPLDDRHTLLAFHGSPRSFLDELLPTTPSERLDQLLAGHPETILGAGHTHIQMLRHHHGRLIVNPGSVGMPFAEPFSGTAPTLMAHAEWATIELTGNGIHLGLRRVDLDRTALRQAAAGSTCPLAPWFLEQWSEPSA